MLEKEIGDHVNIAGVRVVEARISHLAYSQEVASAMLQRQEATALVSARRKIVQGAVGIVELALEEITKKGLVEFTKDQKAQMVGPILQIWYLLPQRQWVVQEW